MTRDQLIWLAGFIDGEGYIGIVSKNVRYQAQLRIATTHHETMLHVARLMECKLHSRKYKSNPGWKSLYSATIYDKKCEILLKELLPFLVTKREQATNLIKFRSTVEYGRNQTSGPRKVDQRPFYELSKFLNLKGQTTGLS